MDCSDASHPVPGNSRTGCLPFSDASANQGQSEKLILPSAGRPPFSTWITHKFCYRPIFCFFAEDTGLLPKNLFSDIAKIALEDPHQFSQALESLFRTMAKGGMFGQHKILHFNGHLFEDTTVFELNDDERRILVEAAEADWQFVEPSIMGTLFARGLDPDQRAALGAQYTSRDDIVTLVEPVLMAPLRREWAVPKSVAAPRAQAWQRHFSRPRSF